MVVSMTKDEALCLALEALKQIDEAMPFPVAKLAQKVIKEALAQTEQEPCCYGGIAHDCHAGEGCRIVKRMKAAQTEQEPVAWAKFSAKGNIIDLLNEPDDDYTPLYTTPPQRTWVGLTDEEIKRIGKLDLDSNYFGLWYDFAKAIEDKLKEKNT